MNQVNLVRSYASFVHMCASVHVAYRIAKQYRVLHILFYHYDDAKTVFWKNFFVQIHHMERHTPGTYLS